MRDAPFYKIDWHAQWAAHGSDFHNGCVHVDLKQYGTRRQEFVPSVLKLQPGPGFGDLSHPTTHLVLKLMSNHVKNENVIDIGCGSGILSLAAAAMGAKSVTGIDIDEGAVIHAKSNSQLNGMDKTIDFILPQHFHPKNHAKNSKTDFIILMNMIESEQIQASNSLPTIHPHTKTAITSGILKEGRKSYLKLTQSWGWQLQAETEESGWLGFIFSQQ